MKTEYRYSSSALFEVIDGRVMQTAANRLRIIRAIVRLIGKKKFGRVPFHFSPTYGNNFPARKTFSINSMPAMAHNSIGQELARFIRRISRNDFKSNFQGRALSTRIELNSWKCFALNMDHTHCVCYVPFFVMKIINHTVVIGKRILFNTRRLIINIFIKTLVIKCSFCN